MKEEKGCQAKASKPARNNRKKEEKELLYHVILPIIFTGLFTMDIIVA